MDFEKLLLAKEELKFIRSLEDLKNYYEKMIYLAPRVLGLPYRHYKVPPSLQLEPTNICNLRCICCSSSRSNRKKGYLEWSLFKHIIENAANIGTKIIHLYLHGEPFLHPQIIDMIRYIKKNGMTFHLTTNGTMLKPEAVESLLDSGASSADHVQISILGHAPDVHEKIMKGVVHEEVVENVLSLVRQRNMRKLNGPVVETIFYLMPENRTDKQAFLDFWRTRVDHARVHERISIAFADFGKERLYIPPRQNTCSNLWERMTINWNGDVILCCSDVAGQYLLGNLRVKSIEEIWNSSFFLSLKKIHKEKTFSEFPFCNQCDT